jgi:phosphotriesterase-related protein
MAPFVQTVRGPVDPADLGRVLPHEHTKCVLWQIPNRWDYWQLTGEDDVIADELGPLREHGVGTVVDVSLDAIGREPERLVRLSETTGLNVVMGCGWYRGAYYPPEARIDRRSVDDLADEIVREWEEGVAGTGIRPGIIGEIGTDKPWLSAQEERVHRAAARAAKRTGMAVTTHGVLSAVGAAQLGILEEEGLDAERVVIGHADSHPQLPHLLALVERGATVEFDFLGMTFTVQERHAEPRLVELVGELVARGHAQRLLFSQDVCHDSQLTRYGGNGYAYIFRSWLPRLREAGVPEDALETIVRDNPRRILTIG